MLGFGEPLVNHALDVGVESKARKEGDATLRPLWDAPACIDGDRKTPTYATEIDVVLPEPRPIRKVVVHAPDVINVELYVRQSARTGWQLRRSYHDHTGAAIKEDISDLGLVDGVKVVIRKSARDSVIGVEEAMTLLGEAADRAVRGLNLGTTSQHQDDDACDDGTRASRRATLVRAGL
ncbi:MAG: hypothetical protein O3A46_09660 [Candidatus Poribacteria bacterium]|nr:hypothetical protein [Candidatus Poribacteria bacterium]